MSKTIELTEQEISDLATAVNMALVLARKNQANLKKHGVAFRDLKKKLNKLIGVL